MPAVFSQRKQDAITRYLADRKPIPFFRAHTAALDDEIRRLWHELCGAHSRLCLLAIGGYGRGEVYPHSDIDLAIIAAEAMTEAEEAQTAALVQALWDRQLTPAVQSGSLQQLLDTAAQDLNTDTALLEARPLSGNPELAATALAAFSRQRDTAAFIESKLLEMQQRHAKQPALVLEPNIKHCVGGLRDLHTMMWLAQAQGLPHDFYALMRQNIITRTEASLLRRCHRRLARLRIELHLAAGREEDRLIFDLQSRLAAADGLDADSRQAATETLMRRFYRTAKTVMQLTGILIPMLRGRCYSLLPRNTADIDADYYRVGNQIAAKDLHLFAKQPQHLFKIIEILQQNRDLTGIAPKTLRQWWAASRQMDDSFYRQPENRARFLGFFRHGTGLTHTLRLLNLYGLLSRYLPDWHKIVGLLQHDLFHIYPVDDHILTVVRNMRRLAMERHSHELPFASGLMAAFRQPYILYLAALFHDIAKGRHGDHAQLGAADAQRFAQDHQLPAADGELLVWLVREHLLMSSVAQKEDIQDPAVVERFCRRVGSRERLDALYLLTVADIRGTNPQIWNSWKAQLLLQLFQAAAAHLAGGQSGSGNHLQQRRHEAETQLADQGIGAAAIRQLFNRLGEAYFPRHPPEIIRWHMSLYRDNGFPAAAVRRRTADTLQLMVCMPNGERLFTRLCRLIGRHGLDIAAARAYITADNHILNTFTATLPDNRLDEAEQLAGQLQQRLADFARQPHEINASAAKPARRSRFQAIVPHIEIEPDPEHNGRYTLEMTCTNRPYLLADITEVFARHQISLHYAKIATLAERVEDSFYISCPELTPATAWSLKQDLAAAVAA